MPVSSPGGGCGSGRLQIQSQHLGDFNSGQPPRNAICQFGKRCAVASRWQELIEGHACFKSRRHVVRIKNPWAFTNLSLQLYLIVAASPSRMRSPSIAGVLVQPNPDDDNNLFNRNDCVSDHLG